MLSSIYYNSSNLRRPDNRPTRSRNFSGLLFNSPVIIQSCRCESEDRNDDNNTLPAANGMTFDKQQRSSQNDRNDVNKVENDKSCLSCLIVGVCTSMGLSTYFGYVAFEPPTPSETVLAHMRRNSFCLAVSAGWFCIGVYRLYLG